MSTKAALLQRAHRLAARLARDDYHGFVEYVGVDDDGQPLEQRPLDRMVWDFVEKTHAAGSPAGVMLPMGFGKTTQFCYRCAWEIGRDPNLLGSIVTDSLDIPPAGQGACCFDDGQCVETTAALCVGSGGVYEGDFTDCSPNPCPQYGACCFADGNCADWLQVDCDVKGGTWQGPGTGCDPNVCPPPPDPNGWVVTVVETRLTSDSLDRYDGRIDAGVITYTVQNQDDKDVRGLDALDRLGAAFASCAIRRSNATR